MTKKIRVLTIKLNIMALKDKNSHLYTLGYENISFEVFASTLVKNKIKTLVDIRDYPKSRKKGFSKNELKSFFSKNGINYIHLRSLGSPSDIRRKLKKDKKYREFFKKYKEYLIHQSEALEELTTLTESNKTCIFCYEEDYNLCHRKVVAAYLNVIKEGKFDIVHM